MNLNTSSLIAVTLLFTIAAFIAYTIPTKQPTQETTNYTIPEAVVSCTTNDSRIHAEQGWKKIETVDYHRIGALAGKGKAQVDCKPGTLMCTAFINGKVYPETKGCAWYWRKV